MFWTALYFEPSCLWIRHQPLQTRRFNYRQHWLNSNPISWFGRKVQLKAFPKKVLHCTFFKFYSNQDIKNLKDQDLDYLVGLLGLDHVVFVKKKKKSNGLYVSVRSWKLNVIIENRGIDYLVLVMFLWENSIMTCLFWSLLSFSRIFITIDNTCQRDHGKHLIN